MRRNQRLKGKFGVFVECHFGKRVVAMTMAMDLLHLHLHQWATTMFISKDKVVSLVKDQLWRLQMQFLLWQNLCFLLEEDSGLILPTSYTFLVRICCYFLPFNGGLFLFGWGLWFCFVSLYDLFHMGVFWSDLFGSFGLVSIAWFCQLMELKGVHLLIANLGLLCLILWNCKLIHTGSLD